MPRHYGYKNIIGCNREVATQNYAACSMCSDIQIEGGLC